MNMAPSIPKWRTLIFEELELTPEFFARERDTIRKRLIEAYQEMTGKTDVTRPSPDPAGQALPPSEMFGIHECFHLAASVVMMGAGSTTLRDVLAEMENSKVASLKGKNAMTVLTAVVLYYLVTHPHLLAHSVPSGDQPGREAGDLREACEFIHRRFDDLNWMVGVDAMSHLNIERLPPPRTDAPPAD